MTKYHIKDNDISDGYHTFNELYAHRVMLWINIILMNKENSCFVKEHYEGWDLLVLIDNEGRQLSYHVPISNRYLYIEKIKETKLEDHKYDGHNSDDVLRRLIYMAGEKP